MSKALRNLPFPVTPKANESLVGVMLRASVANGLPSPASIMTAVTGKDARPPGIEHIEALASVLGCDPMSLPPLLGFTTRKQGERRWHIDGQVLTKEYFIRSRSMAICPECL